MTLYVQLQVTCTNRIAVIHSRPIASQVIPLDNLELPYTVPRITLLLSG